MSYEYRNYIGGGIGSRLGAEVPKQFVEVLGKPILAYTIDAFQQHPDIDAALVVCLESHMEQMLGLIERYKLSKVKWTTKGGHDFQHSVLNAVNFLADKCNPEDVVLVHFGASPFVTPDIISDAIEVCRVMGNAISSTPFYLLSGTRNSDNTSLEWIDRDSIVCMNSPHAFVFRNLQSIYSEGIRTGLIDKVEPHTTTLMYKLGWPVYLSRGSQTNIKITTKEDLELFRAYAYYRSIGNLQKPKVKSGISVAKTQA